MRRMLLLAVVAAVFLAVAFVPAGAAPSDANQGTAVPEATIQATSAPSTGEMSYFKVTPCRIVDTRVSGGALTPNETRTFYASGTTGFDTQGGTAGGCGIPNDAGAVEFTLTAVDPLGSGYMRLDVPSIFFPAPEPKATVLNYSPALNATNSVIGPIVHYIAPFTDKHFLVKNYASTSHLVVDVTGYFKPDLHMYAVVNADATLNRGASVSSVAKITTGRYEVIFSHDVTACSYVATLGDPGTGVADAGFVTVARRSGETNGVFVRTMDTTGTDTDRSFYLNVDC